MSRSTLGRFRARLALTAYMRKLFGIPDPHDAGSVGKFYEALDEVGAGESTDGTSHVYHFVAARVAASPLDESDLLRYERNVRSHIDEMNKRRAAPIQLKPFQRLAGLMTEAYLDRLFQDRSQFLTDLNSFVDEANAEHKGRIKYPSLEDSDLNKLAYWMATGSGKTLLLHLNYYQYLSYASAARQLPNNVLLVTPNEGLSSQHLERLHRSGIAGHTFNAQTADLWTGGENPVKVIEIHKLTANKGSESGLSVPVDSLEGRNLVFVDEAHKGTASNAQTWVGYREAIASDGFTFEYSAAFGHALAGAGTDIEEQYGKTILFDYSYPRFHQDGYGKDYEILNLGGSVQRELRDRYLLGNLLAFYQQFYFFSNGPDELRSVFNIYPPLLVFVGHSVNAEKTVSGLTKTDRQSLSDVEEILTFFARVLRNESGRIPGEIEGLLSGDTELRTGGGRDLFEDAYPVLEASGLGADAIYGAMLRDLFHAEAPTRLVLDDIAAAEGEIGLRAVESERPFGVINIGNDRVFLDRVADRYAPEIVVRSDQFSSSLFDSIGAFDSPISVLIGAKKFIAGWDSWRVSSLGLMNFGRQEGSQVIQLFGRGVRLLGKGRSLKRSSALETDTSPDHIGLLETLRVFGVRADYMSAFKQHLDEEGIDVSEKEVVSIPTKRLTDFEAKGLVVVRPDEDRIFGRECRFVFDSTSGPTPEVDLTPRLEVIASETGQNGTTGNRSQEREIPDELVPLLDWSRLYREVWQFRESRGYRNMAVPKECLQEMIDDGRYRLFCPEEFLRVEKASDIQEKLEPVALAILRQAVELQYEEKRRAFERETLRFVPVKSEVGRQPGNFPEQYEAEVEADAKELLKVLQAAVEEDEELYESEDGLPSRVHFDRHLYLPLLAERPGAADIDVSYRPPALNEGERAFVEALRAYLEEPDGEEILEEWEVFLLRNRSRGHGIGFLLGKNHDERFYPDFILWLKSNTCQHVVFIEPHGLALEGEPLENHRVRFHGVIKEYEEQLEAQGGRSDVHLHSYVISQTELRSLLKRSRASTVSDFHDEGIYFREDGVAPILEAVLTNGAE